MPNGGPLWFDTDQHEDMIEISIKDFGKGVHPQQIHDIFDPFYTTQEHKQGLGLSIAQGIIQNHEGKIRVESEVGVGSEFIIELPVKG